MVSFPRRHLLCIGITMVAIATVLHVAEFNNFYGTFDECEDAGSEIDTIVDHGTTRCQDFDFYKLAVQLLAYLAVVFGMTGAGTATVLQLSLFSSCRFGVRTFSAIATVSAATCFVAFGFTISATGLYTDWLASDGAIRKGYQSQILPLIMCSVSAAFYVAGGVLIVAASKFVTTDIVKG